MAQQTINIGAAANDGTGDPLRTAFDKANDNFDELYGRTAAASESASGIVELATTAEATTGTDTARAVTPAGLKAHVDAAIAAIRNGVSSAFDTLAEIATELALKATLASPTFTGTPAAPTATKATSTTQLATTAFVQELAKSKLITVTRDLTAASETGVAVTGVGFAPRTLEVIGYVGGVNGFASRGMCDAALTQKVVVSVDGSVALPYNALLAAGASSTNIQTAVVASLDADGFTLSWTKTGSPTGTASFYVLCRS